MLKVAITIIYFSFKQEVQQQLKLMVYQFFKELYRLDIQLVKEQMFHVSKFIRFQSLRKIIFFSTAAFLNIGCYVPWIEEQISGVVVTQKVKVQTTTTTTESAVLIPANSKESTDFGEDDLAK